MKRCSMTIVAVLFAGPALAQTAPVSQSPAKPKTTCRTAVITGSRMPVRTCHAAKEWADVDSGHRRDVDRGNLVLNTISKAQTDSVGTPSFQ